MGTRVAVWLQQGKGALLRGAGGVRCWCAPKDGLSIPVVGADGK